MACYRLNVIHVLLNLTPKDGGQTPSGHKGIIAPSPGMLQN